jgi:hypothetical protein
MNKNLRDQFIKQLRNLLDEYSAKMKLAKYPDLSDLGQQVAYVFLTRSKAAIETIAGRDSTYSRLVERIQETKGQHDFDRLKQIMGVVEGLCTDLEGGSLEPVPEPIPEHGDEDTTQLFPEKPGDESESVEERVAKLEGIVQKRGYDTRPIYEKHEQEIQGITERLRKLGDHQMDHLDRSLERKCIYCANGVYRKVLDSRNILEGELPNELLYWGIAYRPAAVGRWWVVFSCNYCGNVQAFHLLDVQHSDAWK